MKKSIKYISVLFLFLLFFNSVCLATDIDMNLQSTEFVENTDIDANTEEDLNTQADMNNETVDSEDFYTTVTTTSTEDEDPFTIANIIDIFLIVVGIVLILLGLAILVRLKY